MKLFCETAFESNLGGNNHFIHVHSQSVASALESIYETVDAGLMREGFEMIPIREERR